MTHNVMELSRTDALVEAAAYAVEGLFNLFVDESVENGKEKEQLGPDTNNKLLSITFNQKNYKL